MGNGDASRSVLGLSDRFDRDRSWDWGRWIPGSSERTPCSPPKTIIIAYFLFLTHIVNIAFYKHSSFNFLSKYFLCNYCIYVFLDGGPLEKQLLLKGDPPKSIHVVIQVQTLILTTT